MQRLQRAMGMLIAVFGLVCVLSVGLSMTGCEKSTEDKMEDAADDMQDAADDAADEMKDAVEDAGDEIEDATDG